MNRIFDSAVQRGSMQKTIGEFPERSGGFPRSRELLECYRSSSIAGAMAPAAQVLTRP